MFEYKPTYKVTNRQGYSFWKALGIFEVHAYQRRGYTVIICR